MDKKELNHLIEANSKKSQIEILKIEKNKIVLKKGSNEILEFNNEQFIDKVSNIFQVINKIFEGTGIESSICQYIKVALSYDLRFMFHTKSTPQEAKRINNEFLGDSELTDKLNAIEFNIEQPEILIDRFLMLLTNKRFSKAINPDCKEIGIKACRGIKKLMALPEKDVNRLFDYYKDQDFYQVMAVICDFSDKSTSEILTFIFDLPLCPENTKTKHLPYFLTGMFVAFFLGIVEEASSDFYHTAKNLIFNEIPASLKQIEEQQNMNFDLTQKSENFGLTINETNKK